MLDIGDENLNEISLEDIEIEADSRFRVYQALYDMVCCNDPKQPLSPAEDTQPGVPCTGFWVEDTMELVLFAWNQERTKTIVIPSEEWFLRDDITLH